MDRCGAYNARSHLSKCTRRHCVTLTSKLRLLLSTFVQVHWRQPIDNYHVSAAEHVEVESIDTNARQR